MKNIGIFNIIEYAYIFHYKLEVGVGTPSSDGPGHKKTPEMNELEPGYNSLKIWAHNFEKQKSWSKNKKCLQNDWYFSKNQPPNWKCYTRPQIGTHVRAYSAFPMKWNSILYFISKKKQFQFPF